MDLNALAFLRTILPDGGWYAAFTKVNERRQYNRFFATIEELAHHIGTEDAQGKTVYHACASFVEPQHRYANKAWGAKSLWLDIDAGKPDSPYATAVDAAQAVFQFARVVGLPPPLVVGSGYGVHCYWPFSCSISPGDWLELASGLKGAAIKFGLHADPSRTTDLASVLRTPGTHNRKFQEIRPVVIGPTVGAWPYDVEIFDHLLDYISGAPSAVRDKAVSALPTLTQALIVEPDYAPVHADDIADQCAQVKWLRDAQGCTPEPHWYAVLGVLSRCVDGQEKAHEWSKGHPQYQPLETENKYQRTLALTGATTCAKFESINYRGCDGCPFKGRITSPISLPTAAPPNVVAAPLGAAIHDTLLPLLPLPFDWSAKSQLIFHTSKGEENVETVLSQYPLFLAGVGVGEVRSDRFSFHFRQWLPHRGWFDIFIAAGKLFGPSGVAELAERGATIHDPKLFLGYARAAADQFHAVARLKMQYDQCGWKEDYSGFLVGTHFTQQRGSTSMSQSARNCTPARSGSGRSKGRSKGGAGAANALLLAGANRNLLLSHVHSLLRLCDYKRLMKVEQSLIYCLAEAALERRQRSRQSIPRGASNRG
jgi:hypothetical protein